MVTFADDDGRLVGEPPTYEALVDQLLHISLELEQVGTIPLPEAQDVCKRLQQAERKVWQFRRSVEAAWWSKHATGVEIVMVTAAQEGRRASEVLLELMEEGALQPVWWKLDKFAALHGVVIDHGLPDEDEETPDPESDTQ